MLDELGLRCIKQVGIDDWRDWDSDPLGFGTSAHRLSRASGRSAWADLRGINAGKSDTNTVRIAQRVALNDSSHLADKGRLHCGGLGQRSGTYPCTRAPKSVA
jgi:hypothetical protein